MEGKWAFFLAGAGGILSFLSPCVLPLVPGYLALISGGTLQELKEKKGLLKSTLFHGVLFVLGFTVVFSLLGASASAVGTVLKSHQKEFSMLAGGILILLGLHTVGVFRIPFLMMEKRARWQTSGGLHPAGIFLTGSLFAFGWSPCVGPILAGILTLAASQSTVAKGVFLLIAYSLGLGIPFLLTGVFLNAFLTFFARYKRGLRIVEVLAGLLLMAVGGLMMTGKLYVISSKLPPSELELSLTKNLKVNVGTTEGKLAPDVTFQFLDGTQKRLYDYKGKVLLVNFWAPWCVPCRTEMPDFVELYHQYRKDGFEIVGVAEQTDEDAIRRFAQEMDIDYPLMLDEKEYVNDVLGEGERSLPRSFLIDKNGTIVLKHIGFLDKETLETVLKKYL